MNPRLQKLTTLLESESCDALLVINSEESGQPETKYLSGFSGSSSVLLISSKNKTLITDSRYTARAKKESPDFKIIILKSGETVSGILKQLTKKLSIRKILIDGSKTWHSTVENLKNNLPDISLISKNRIFQQLRIVKEKSEIALLHRAQQIASTAFLRLLPEIKVGITEKFLATKLDSLCAEEGAEKMSFPTIIASGNNTALPHATPSDKKLRSGELVLIDWGVQYQGYVSDTTRTVALGKISPKLPKIYRAVQVAQEKTCEKIKAGMTCASIDQICRDELAKFGFEKYFTHATGHGIGLEIHELPVLAPNQTEKLLPNMVITCEPGIYIPGIGGVRIEDSLIVTKNGSINLAENLTKNLLIL